MRRPVLAVFAVPLFGALAACDAPEPPGPAGCVEQLPPRRIRLLTRREYDATAKEILARHGLAPGAVGAACASLTDCSPAGESCVAGSCALDPCELHTFTFAAPPGAHGSVIVAGTWNGWGATAATGGLALEYLP